MRPHRTGVVSRVPGKGKVAGLVEASTERIR